jgi:hypothetical protein
MIVRLTSNLIVSATDGLSFELKVRKTKVSQSGEKQEYWKGVGYYSDLRQAAVAALNKGLARGDKSVGIKELIGAIDKASKVIGDSCSRAITAYDAAQVEGVFGDGGIESIFD